MSTASLPTLVKRALLSEGGFHLDSAQMPRGLGIVLGVSGGPDSMALLQVLARLRKTFHFELLAFCVDHGLRDESAEEARLVESYCSQLDVKFQGTRLNIVGNHNLQARARELRFEHLFSVARKEFGSSAMVATAHHRRDRAETVLLRLLRGTSLEGLNVLPVLSQQEAKPPLLRPMIMASREQIDSHISFAHIPCAIDPSNQDPHYLRVRVRNELLPLLEELSPQMESRLESLAIEAGQLEAPLLLTRDQRQQLRGALLDPSRAIDLRLSAGLSVTRKLSPIGKKRR